MHTCTISNTVSNFGQIFSQIKDQTTGEVIQGYQKGSEVNFVSDFGIYVITLWLRNFAEFESLPVVSGIGALHYILAKKGYKLVKSNHSRSGKSYQIDVIKA